MLAAASGIAVGSPDIAYVYLTFDNGHEEGYTPKILDVLKEHSVPATFFITGHYLNSVTELVERMLNEGHIVGNHTVNHPSMPDIDDDRLRAEITNLHSSMHQRFGYEMKFFRPPKGEFSERTLDMTRSLGYTTVMWSFAYDDWDKNNQGRQEYAKNKILDNLHNGAIILLHATSRDNSEILDYVIREIKARGFEFRSLDEFKR
ncbi:MAG: polysaccharide deacetylase family protein [Oscillospiraceae bacterium]|nr:polysaccharide deacetylase family protein [Oscillospiraceae bacterium]